MCARASELKLTTAKCVQQTQNNRLYEKTPKDTGQFTMYIYFFFLQWSDWTPHNHIYVPNSSQFFCIVFSLLYFVLIVFFFFFFFSFSLLLFVPFNHLYFIKFECGFWASNVHLIWPQRVRARETQAIAIQARLLQRNELCTFVWIPIVHGVLVFRVEDENPWVVRMRTRPTNPFARCVSFDIRSIALSCYFVW